MKPLASKSAAMPSATSSGCSIGAKCVAALPKETTRGEGPGRWVGREEVPVEGGPRPADDDGRELGRLTHR